MYITVYENLIWDILDDESKTFIMGILANQEFEGECKLIAKINSEVTELEITDNFNHSLVLPINILDILNN
jgi:hypothetical protein